MPSPVKPYLIIYNFCFAFQDCGLLLDTRKKGRECYPHKDHIYCLKCNRKKFSSDEESSDNDDEN